MAPTAKEAKNGEGPFFKDKEPTPQPEQTPAEAEKDQPPKYILLRFFDFTVKPGAAYRYQVKLVLKNPNYKVEPRYLADSKSAASQAIESPWSEPTGAIVVPPDIRILAELSPCRVQTSQMTICRPFSTRPTAKTHRGEPARKARL